MVRYIGIDPSTKTGICLLNEDGTVYHTHEIKTKEKHDPQRFIEIANRVKEYICHGDKVVIEGFSYGSQGRGVSTQYGVGWVIRTKLVELIEDGVIEDYIEVSPSTLKKFATGKGNTKKEDMILPIYKRWQFENDSDNIRDAFVLAMIGRALDGLGEPTKAQMDCIKGWGKSS